MRRVSVRDVLLILGAIGWAIFRAEPAVTANAKTAHQETRQQAFRLLDAGNYDGALSAYGMWGHALRQGLFRKICDAVRDLSDEEALRLYRPYFQYYPFGHLDWRSDWWSWSNIACDYTELRAASGRGAAGEQTLQDIAAMETYRRLVEYRWKYDRENCAKLADQIVENYPLSVFCSAAVLSVGNLAQDDGVAPAIRTYEEYLAKMRESGSPKRSQILVMVEYADTCVRYAKGKEELRKGLSAYQEIARMTEISYEGGYCLLKAAHAALRMGDEDSLVLSRRLFREFLEKHPGALEAAEAHAGIIRSYSLAGQQDEAVRALHELEESAPPGTDFGEELLAIWLAHFDAGDYERALALLEWLTQLFPQSSLASAAYIGMGETYDKLGEEEKMVASYKKAAGSGSGQDRAVKSLADYYTEKGQWGEALKWWEAWTPSSWCGTCLEGMKDQRARNIATCQAKMGRVEEVFSTLERPPLSEWSAHYGPDILISLVDFYRYRDELDALEEKLKGALAESEHATAVKTAVEYIELLRMADNKDVEGLWEFLSWFQGHPFPPESLYWKSRKAANLLVCMPAETKPFAMAKLSERSGAKYWGPALLARMGAVEILPVLKERMSDEENVHILADYFYAVALLGTDESYAIIKEYAEQGTGNHRTAAQTVLKSYPPPNAQAQNDG